MGSLEMQRSIYIHSRRKMIAIVNQGKDVDGSVFFLLYEAQLTEPPTSA